MRVRHGRRHTGRAAMAICHPMFLELGSSRWPPDNVCSFIALQISVHHGKINLLCGEFLFCFRASRDFLYSHQIQIAFSATGVGTVDLA